MSSQQTAWLNRDSLLLCFSAFFADLGWQSVSALFPLLLVIEMHEPIYIYGIILAVGYGGGSLLSVVGGKLGDKFSKKRVSIIGNLVIALMSLTAISPSPFLMALLFIGGLGARYFRTAPRQAWLVNLSRPEHRSKIFGLLQALDVGGGMLATVYTVILVVLGFMLRQIILVTILPLLVSSICLLMAQARNTPPPEWTENKNAAASSVSVKDDLKQEVESELKTKHNRFVYRAVLLTATMFGFAYYSPGFVVLTVSLSMHSLALGVIEAGIFLAFSGLAGFVLGSKRGGTPLGTLWRLGYLLAAFSSLAIGFIYQFNVGLVPYYLAAAGLGFGTGSVETFEPVITSTVVKSTEMSSAMGWLGAGRGLGLFVSNLVMGALLSISQLVGYGFAFAMAFSAAMVLLVVQIKTGMK